MSNPPRDSQRIHVYRLGCSGYHLITGRAIDANTLTLIADRADASRYAQRVGRVYRRKRGRRTARDS